MQSASLCTAFILSCGTWYSLPSSGLSYPGWRYGFIALNFSQNGSMSTTRSFTIGRFPIAEIVGISPACAMSYIRTLHASTAAPFIRMPHEPQIIMRQLFRYARDPSTLSFTMSRQSRSVASSGASISYSLSARSPLEESYRQIFRATCTRSASQSRNRCLRAVERLCRLRNVDAHVLAELRELGCDRRDRA